MVTEMQKIYNVQAYMMKIGFDTYDKDMHVYSDNMSNFPTTENSNCI